MRYKVKPPKHEPDFVSLEELPLSDYENDYAGLTKQQAAKRFWAAFLILFLSGFLVFIFANRQKLTYENIINWVQYEMLSQSQFKGTGYPVSFVGSRIDCGNFISMGNYIVYSSNTSFVTLNSSAGEIFKKQIRYHQPILKKSDNRLLIYNLGSRGFEINSVNKTIYESETDDKIITGDISLNGTYALVTQAEGFLSKLHVFKDNKEVYTYYFLNDYINSVSLNKDGTKGILSGISSNSSSLKTKIFLFDFSKLKPVHEYEFDNNLIYDIKYLTETIAVTIGSSSAYHINLNKWEITERKYDEMLLTGYDISTDSSSYVLSLSRNGDGRACTLMYYSAIINMDKAISTELKISSVSIYKDRIAVLSQNKGYLYNRSGEMLRETDAGNDSRQIRLYNEHRAYILGATEIRQIDF